MLSRLQPQHWTHIHGVLAGALLIVTVYVSVALPEAIARILGGDLGWTAVTIPFLVALFLLVGVREAKAWYRGAHASSTPA